MDILEQAAAVVNGVERNVLLERITAMLERHPDGLAVFVVSDGDPENTKILEITGNTTVFGLDWLLWAARVNMREDTFDE